VFLTRTGILVAGSDEPIRGQLPRLNPSTGDELDFEWKAGRSSNSHAS
jgi:hypothetical protein